MHPLSLTLPQLKQLLFPDYYTGLEEANALRIRVLYDRNECIAVPKWFAVAIAETPEFDNTFHIQYLESHPILWPREAWMRSPDRKAAIINNARRVMREERATTKYQQQAYEFVTSLANRIVDNYFPHMKKGYLKSSFQRALVSRNYDLKRFRESLEDTFDEVVITTCWVNEPEKPENENDKPRSEEGDPQPAQIQEGEREASGYEHEEDEQTVDEDRDTRSRDHLASGGHEQCVEDLRSTSHGADQQDVAGADDGV